MKQFFKDYFWVLSLGVLLLTGCSTEQEIINPDEGNAVNKITFSFPISKAVATYTPVTPIGDESLFSASDMTIYMVDDAGGVIEGMFSGTGITSSVSGSVLSATITLKEVVTSPKTFYFVANTSSVSANLSSIGIGSRLSELLNVVTAVQTAQLSSSGGLLLTGSTNVSATDIANASSATPTPISVTLRRRVARFDISNDAATSKVTIKKVLISNAQKTALVFADKDSLPKTKGWLPDIDFTAIAGANGGVNQSAFYLYPSDSVAIQLLTEVGGIEQLYRLPLPAAGIEANKRYTISARYGAQSPVFAIEADSWSDGIDIEAAMESSVNIRSIAVAEYNEGWWDAGAKRYDASARGNVINLTVATSSASGVLVDVVGAPGGYSITSTKESPTLTYAAGYTQIIKINIPQYTGKTDLDAKVIIKDASNPVKRDTITVVGGDYYPTAHNGWAGCNIYYDEITKHLTFDDVGVTEHEQYQGVYFKWGSLWGISPKGAWDGTTRLYPPTGDTISAVDRLASFDWNTIVPFVDTLQLNPASGKNRRDWAYLYQITNGETGKGDICKWLTRKGWTPGAPGKKWRLPTSNEFEATLEISYTKTGGFAIVVIDKSDGTHLITSGYRKGPNPADLFFPASGHRNTDEGLLTNVGAYGYAWSGSPYTNGGYSYSLGFASSVMGLASSNHRANGFPIRCVAE